MINSLQRLLIVLLVHYLNPKSPFLLFPVQISLESFVKYDGKKIERKNIEKQNHNADEY